MQCNGLGQEDGIRNEIYELSEQFLCTFYGHKEDRYVSAVQYKMYCAKHGKCEAKSSL